MSWFRLCISPNSSNCKLRMAIRRYMSFTSVTVRGDQSRSAIAAVRGQMRESIVSGVTHSARSEEHTSELQSQSNLVCRLLLEKKKKEQKYYHIHTQQM